MLLLASALAAYGLLLAVSTGLFKISLMRRSLVAIWGALAPAASLYLAAGTFITDRGQYEDLKLRLLAAAFSLFIFVVSVLISGGLKYRNPRLHVPMMLLTCVAISWVSTAPALL